MTRSLLKAGFPVTVAAHRRREALERLVADGATEAPDAKAVAAASDITITCVPDAPQVEEVLFGERGVAQGAPRGSVVIDMSTISPVASQRFAERLASQGVDFVDAPVSGGPARATTGTLTIMVGGDAAAFERARPVFQAMGKRITHIGPSGHGQTAKLCNQILVAVNLLADVALVSLDPRVRAG